MLYGQIAAEGYEVIIDTISAWLFICKTPDLIGQTMSNRPAQFGHKGTFDIVSTIVDNLRRTMRSSQSHSMEIESWE
ncbi:hypothetical protein LMG28727_02930 [Paraburkholderia kirstenboschensis]|uniref:hypothetical protein n=1 Tax=Paraburkholderia kirstenboschensis TaxID=1245436 RepID=UPI000A95EC13|nr:hypothetical protein [Paraburkholderia kirstenboschensis]CAD6532389.1 hypothetical protein LMG28727_02930 [Paraburkholderia kirstenboschensis]